MCSVSTNLQLMMMHDGSIFELLLQSRPIPHFNQEAGWIYCLFSKLELKSSRNACGEGV